MRLAELKVEELPPELARLPEAERVAYLEGKAARRAALQREVNQLARKRQAFVDETTREQVARKGIRYAGPRPRPDARRGRRTDCTSRGSSSCGWW